MKKKIPVLLLVALVITLAVCFQKNKTYKGADELLEKAREVIPLSEADTIDLSYAGICGKEDRALVWFISGNEYQHHSYFPLECTVVGKDEYQYERIHKPMEYGSDIAVLPWMGGYAFLINEPDCAAVRLTGETGTRDEIIKLDCLPYVFYYEGTPSVITFLDKDGNEIP